MPTHESLNVLVTGATGNQGGAVARALLERHHHVRALTRTPHSSAARTLHNAGADIIQGDLADSTSLRAALHGADAMFLMATPYEAGIDAEITHASTAIDAAANVGLAHLVYSSGASVDRATGIPHFDSKHEIERRLRASGVPFTILGPAFFMENVLSPLWLPALKHGELRLALPPDRRIQMISMGTIAAFAVAAFENRDSFTGVRLDIASDELSGAEVAHRLSGLSNREIAYVQEPLSAMRVLGEDFAIMFDWFDRAGYSVDIDGLRDRYPDIESQRFGTWAGRLDWRSILAPPIAS